MGLSVKNIHANIGEYQRAYLYKLFWEGPTYPNKTAPDGRSLESVLKAVTGSDKFIRNIDIYNGKAFFPNRKTQEEKIAWAGEFFEVPTVDSSTRDGNLEMFGDEPMIVYRFFNALKDLTGNEENQAGIWGIAGKFNLGIAQISVDKKTITLYRRIIGCRCYEVKMDDNDKAATGISRVTAEIRWDRGELDASKVGQTLEDD